MGRGTRTSTLAVERHPTEQQVQRALTHLSHEPVVRPRAVVQTPGGANKPRGLWYEIDGSWRRWCVREGYDRPLRDRFVHAVTLSSERILRLATCEAVSAFHDEYAVPCEALRGEDGAHEQDRTTWCPDWAQVARHYDGIEIAPFTRHALAYGWHYSWDVDSGCVWRPAAASALTCIARMVGDGAGAFAAQPIEPVASSTKSMAQGGAGASPRAAQAG